MISPVSYKELFLIVFFIWFLVRAYYAGIARKRSTVKHAVKPGFEQALVGLNFIGMMILPLVCALTPWLDGFEMHLPQWGQFLFILIELFNVILFAKIHADLGENWSSILVIKHGHALVRTGIYQWIRHPMYAHLWLWVIGQGIILDNSLVLLYGIIAWGVLYWSRVPREEEMLMKEFGDEYRDYMGKTGRVIPKL